MKRYLFALGLLLFSYSISAKKVKFAVDMTGVPLSATGIHVYGNFQEAAGFPYDWDPASTAMTQEVNDTNIYSVVLDLPAFRVYNYQFINGSHTYETEFVPEESRFNGAFESSRWMYLDSLSDDTMFIGAIAYETNAPVGLSLVVFRVNMILQNVSDDSVHVSGSFQGWNPASSMMITIDDTVYRYQAYIPNGTYQYKFVNGNSNSGLEYVGGACAVNGSRQVTISGDIVLEPANFGSCLVGVEENTLALKASLFPNPASTMSTIEFNDNRSEHQVLVSDVTGRLVQSQICTSNSAAIESLDPGVYTVSVISGNETWTRRLVMQ